MKISLLRSTAIVGLMTLLSRILGLLRDIVFARYFGATGGTDAFFIAFKIPNFMRRLFAEGAFSQAFVPVFTQYKETRSPEDLKDLINHVAGSLGGLLIIISSVGMLAAPLMVYLFAPGYWDNPQRFALTADMLRITFPYIFFMAMTAFSGGILNSYSKFAVPAFTPVLLNLTLITAAMVFSSRFEQPIMALAWGVAIAGLLQLLFQFPFLLHLKLMPVPAIRRGHEGVKHIINLMLPAIVGSSVAQINLLFDTIIASFLVAGSVSWLYYSDRLVEFPLGVFGIALATVILPNLSREHANQSADGFNKTLNWALRLMLLIALPAAIGLFMLSGPLLVTLFSYGKFDLYSAQMSQLSLMAYTLGLPAFVAIKILAPGYYARQDTRTPVKIAIRAMLSNMVLNVTFVVPMVMLHINGPHAGLALATSASAYMNAFMLYHGLRKKNILYPDNGWPIYWVQLLLANLGMAAFLFFMNPPLELWHAWTLLDRLPILLGFVMLAAVIYIALLFVMGLRPRHFRH